VDTYTHGHADSVLQSHRWRTVENSAAYLIPSLRPGLDLLDVGCGPGTITVDLAARVAPGRVLGIDVSADPLEEARAAAEAGDPRAMRLLALNAKVNGDTDRAERLLLAAIDRGDVESMWEMGRLVEDRDGLAACEPWFRMAAENGHFVAKRFFRRGNALNQDGSNPL
jgi:SAM-dependent methyltransferase